MKLYPYQDVVTKLQELQAAGTPIEQAAGVAEQMGWSLQELRDARASKGGGGASTVIAPALQGVTFNTSDEIAAGLRRAAGAVGVPERFGGAQDYGQALGEERAILKRARSEAPKTAAAAELGGALVPGLLTAGAAVGPTMLSTLGRSAKVGGLQGLVSGFGAGETLGERGRGAVVGAGIGTGAGVALPLGVEAVKAGARAAASGLVPRTAALGELRQAVARDAMTPQQLAQQADDLAASRPGVSGGQSPVMLMDAGGANVRGLAERVVQTPGAGRTSLEPRLTARQFGQRVRLADDLRVLTGTSKAAFQAIDDTIAERQVAATPLYNQAYAAPLNPADEQVIGQQFKQVINTPYGKTAWSRAQRAIASDPDFLGQNPTQVPLTVQIDFWQRAATDIGSKATKAGAKDQGRSYQKMADNIVGPLDQANPAFAQARAAWAGKSKYLDAIEDGRDIFNDKMPADEFAAMFNKLSPSEQEGFRIGAVGTVIGKLDSAKEAVVPNFTRDLSSAAMKNKLATIMPTPESAEKWARILSSESRFSAVAGKSILNSATPRRLAEMKQAERAEILGSLATEALSSTSAWQFLAGNLRRGGVAVRDTWRSKADEELAKALETQGGPAQTALARAITNPLYTPTPSRIGPVLAAPASVGAVNLLTPDARRPLDPTMPY